MDDCFVTRFGGARARCVRGPLWDSLGGGHLQLAVRSPLSLLTFFAAAKKVSAAPHRGNANRPLTIQGKAPNPDQGKAKALITRPKSAATAKTKITSLRNPDQQQTDT